MRKFMTLLTLACLAISFSGCDAEVIQEASKAVWDGRVISNEMMTALYPSSFHAGSPPYLERDFEAGANLICDEIKLKYRHDFCAEKDINWR